MQHFAILDLIQGLRQTVQAIHAMVEDTAGRGIANLQEVPKLGEVGIATLALQSTATALLTLGFGLSPDVEPVPYLGDSSTVNLATSGLASNAN